MIADLILAAVFLGVLLAPAIIVRIDEYRHSQEDDQTP